MNGRDETSTSFNDGGLSEAAVIRLAARLKHHDASRIIKGIGDDCAVIRTPGSGVLLITSDVMIEGVHFLPDQPPESVGAKLLAVNLSDIAAMGGHPQDAALTLMLPETTPLVWVERFFQGLEEVAKRFGVNLVGGDSSRHPDRITLAMTLTGRARRDEVVYRSGGKPGDLLYVSGTLGDADAGLMLLKDEVRKCESAKVRKGEGLKGEEEVLSQIRNPISEIRYLINRYLAPKPCIELGRLLARTGTASAMIDLSDGLAVGARQLAEASRRAIELDGMALPVSEELQQFCAERSEDSRRWALKSGGDYELLFSVAPESVRRVERFGLKRLQLPTLTRIGRLVNGEPGAVTVRWGDSVRPLEGEGWEHFEMVKDKG